MSHVYRLLSRACEWSIQDYLSSSGGPKCVTLNRKYSPFGLTLNRHVHKARPCTTSESSNGRAVIFYWASSSRNEIICSTLSLSYISHIVGVGGGRHCHKLIWQTFLVLLAGSAFVGLIYGSIQHRLTVRRSIEVGPTQRCDEYLLLTLFKQDKVSPNYHEISTCFDLRQHERRETQLPVCAADSMRCRI